MNIINYDDKCPLRTMKLQEVLNSIETAFIGKCGSGPEHALYLVVYGKIVQASDPSITWEVGNCPVTIDRFVDIEIKVREK